MFKEIVFVLVSIGIVSVSWTSFRDLRAHGFWRFFAFESILLLTLVNIDVWFNDPLSIRQIASWLLLLASAILAVHGFYILQTGGNPMGGGIESTTSLVTRGAYRYIRHPLYTTLLLGGGGVYLKDPSFTAAALLLATVIFVVVTAKTEESENRKKFGGEYTAYMKKTKMFLPFVY